jgi:hypothetical protein
MTYSGTALPIANGGTNATSFTTTNNAVYYTGSAFATAGATQAVTTPFASSTAQTVSNSAYFTNGPVCISCTNANSALLQVGAGTDANTVGAQLYLNIAGNARFAMRDSTNDIEFGGGTDSSGQAFFGTRTNQKFNIQVNGNNYAVFDTSGQFGIFTLAAATGNTLCYNTTSNTGYDTISTCSSLRALKKNIKPLALPSDLLMHLNPVSFTDRASNENRYGFIAEDVNTVDPVLSSYYHGTLNGVDYNGVTSLLVKTVQDQQHTIDDLTKRIDALEKK